MHGSDESAASSVELLVLAKQGDDEALNRLLARYLPRLRRWASGRLPTWARDATDTEDLVQDTLVKAVARLEDFSPRHDGALQAYLREAVRNRIRDEIRRRSRMPEAAVLDSGIAGGGPSPLEHTIGIEALNRYDAALARLSADRA